MAYASAEIPSDERGWTAADKDMLCGRNWLRDASTVIWTQTGNTSDSDESATGFEAVHGYDGFVHVTTKGDATNNDWYYAVDYGSGGMEIDTLTIAGLSGADGVRVRLQIADDAIFTSNLITVADRTLTTPAEDRIGELDLFHTGSIARRYTSVRYLRIWFNGTSITPAFTECFIGRRRQLKHNSDAPFDPNNLASLIDETVSISGIRQRVVRSKGQKNLAMNISPHEDARIADVESFYEDDTDFGTELFCYWPEPDTSPDAFNMMHMDNPELIGPTPDIFERDFSFTATEQGPNYLALE